MADPILDRLRAADPAAAEPLPGPESPRAQRLLQRILAEPRTDPAAGRPLRRRRLVAAIAVAALALGSVAAAYLVRRPVTDPVALTCYEGLDLDSDAVALRSGRALDAAACASVWRDGTLANPAVAPAGAVPPLTACVTTNGAVAVFPTGDAAHCDRPGLGRVDPASVVGGEAVRALNDRLAGYFAAQRCATMEEAEAEIAAALTALDLSGWTVTAGEPAEARPCASFSLDAARRTIVLVPIPEP